MNTNNPESAPTRCDLLVIGSGAGGLSAAVTAAHLGLKVIVIEKEPLFGGTTAWSGGWMWVPRNPLAVAAGIVEDIEGPRTYLRHEIGDHYDEQKVESFLAYGPTMVDFFQKNTAMRFVDGNAVPDFHGDSPGAAEGGRSVCAAPYDGRELGGNIARLRPPLDLISLWGMGIASGADVRHFLNAMRSWRSFTHVTRRVTRHLKDRVLRGHGMQLVNGNALVARLAKSAFDKGVEVRTSTAAQRLIVEAGRVLGAVVASPTGPIEIRAARGVVLACGGFPHDEHRKSRLMTHAPTGKEHWSAAPPCNTGDGLRLGEQAGGVLDTSIASSGAWSPVSLVTRRDGSVGAFPHLLERAKPGVIAVTRNGKRFTNEADSYYDVIDALLKAVPQGQPIEAWLICDRHFIRHYGLGAAKPAPMPLWPHVTSGYLKTGSSIEELAKACDVNAAALASTIERVNADARLGVDTEFHRGETQYNRVQGDAAVQPNPCVAPIEHGPFYAVKLQPGSLGTFTGLATDASCRVLDGSGHVIDGLYANGNDMSPVMGGRYPAGGITLGPAMTFGYILAHHAAGRALPIPQPAATTTTPASTETTHAA
jgi:succinate dehydrogenase/fumarate reductase flavoprotein subunit